MFHFRFSHLPGWIFLILLFSCSSPKDKEAKQVKYTEKITAFTSGVLSSESSVRIQFSEEVKDAKPGAEVSSGVLKITPKLNGNATWEDGRTIVFTPKDRMSSSTEFKVEVNLPELFAGEKKPFEFYFSTIEQNFRVVKGSLSHVDKDNFEKNIYTGEVITADKMDNSVVENILKATQDGKELEITWEHNNSDNKHTFRVNNVIRRNSAGTLVISYDGSVAGINRKGTFDVVIPSLKDFKVMDVKVVQQPEQLVRIVFSDPLLQPQNLNGLITIGSIQGLKFKIQNNTIDVYLPSRLSGINSVTIYPGIKNGLNFALSGKEQYDLGFESPKPQVKFIGEGTIIPDSKGLILPFKTVGLKAIEVKMIKIFENNVASFLQTNRMDGSNQLRRAGRLVQKKVIRLDNDRTRDLLRWNAFTFDLSELIKPEPGAIYRIVLQMKKEYSVYPCNDTESKEIDFEGESEITESEADYWETPEPYYYASWNEYYSDYNYSERDDPCYDSYYRYKSVGKNILASNLGIIAKQGTGKEMIVAVTDLLTTKPVAGAEITILDYQNQTVGQAKTGADGLAIIPVSHKPYLLVAKQSEQRGYLRLDEASSLSLSRFDVSGQVMQKGKIGFIYGERGVWRPGDTLFISFILKSVENNLPADIPVIFELINPHGQTVNKQVNSSGVNGLYVFKTSTSADAPTGRWRCRIKVGGSSFEKGLRIETVKPNRLKINLDFGGKKLLINNKTTGKMSVKWLHGAIARGLKADVNITLNQSTTKFKDYKDYIFDDMFRQFYPEEIKGFEGTLNNNGEATISFNINLKERAPGMLKAAFNTRVFEKGGDFSVDRFVIPFAPYKVFVGLKTANGDRRGALVTDTVHRMSVVTVDAEGNRVNSGNLEYQIYKVNRRWWWESNDRNIASYMGSSNNNLIKKGKVKMQNGEGSFPFKISYPEWGRYVVRVIDNTNGHATAKTVFVDWPGWVLKPVGDDPESASMLSFSADKKKYEVGEKATVSFPSSGVGSAFVSIETGSGVLKTFWVEPKEGNSSFSFDITKEMAPNIYVHITMLQPHSQTANSLPIRLYGVIPLMVEDSETHLVPIINTADEFRPEKSATIKVSEKDGKKMSYTLAVVDDGLLDLTRFKTPNPWHQFFAKVALGVHTWDIYNDVLGAYGGKIEQMFSIGGDEDLSENKKITKANRFKPMVKFIGPFNLKAGKTNKHTISIPRYVGSVRVMVVATSGEAFGDAEKTVPVRNPVMVLTTLPRVLSPGETVDVPVAVFAMKDNVKNVSVTLSTNNLFTIQGSNKRDVTFSQPGDKSVTFKIKVNKKQGFGKISVVASAKGETARDDIEVNVENPNPPITKVISNITEPSKSLQIPYTLPGIEGTNKVTFEVSSIPPIDFGRRLKYLTSYPHGCVEQVTSSAFPQLFMNKLMDMPAALQMKTEANVKAAIKKLSGYIRSDGGFGYWPGSNSSNDWCTSYAGHFMLEAEKLGYTLPIGFKQKWMEYQKLKSRQWVFSKKNHGDDLAQAYRLYTLLLAGGSELSAMNRMRNIQGLSVQARWRLAAAYALAGYSDVANKLVDNVSVNPTVQKYYYYTYGSSERDKAMIIETLILLNRRTDAAPLVQSVSKALSGNRWMSTQTTSYCLLAMSKFAGDKTTSSTLSFEWKADADKGSKVRSQKPVYQTPITLTGDSGNVSVSNTSEGIIFTRLILEGIPEQGDMTEQARNLRMTVKYTGMNGEAVNVNKLQQGTDFMAIVTVVNPGTLGSQKDMALSQIFPSGWEIRNTRMEDVVSVHEKDIPDYRDIRDDRVYTYFGIGANRSKTFVVLLNAAYTGRFYLPATTCEAMYNNDVTARKPGRWVTVVKPDE